MEGNKHLQLNEIHCELISDYLRFCKYQLGQRLKSIDYCFTTLINCRVHTTETYTGEEVKNLLTDLQDVVRGEVDTELTDSVHTNILFVQQLLAHAEEWHLTLSGNISELENRKMLNAIKLFDEEQQKSSASRKMSITVTQSRQIIPVEDMNIASALKSEIARLKIDNDFLQGKIISLEKQKNPAETEENVKLLNDLAEAQQEIRRLQSLFQSFTPHPHPEESDSLEKLQIVQQAVDTLSKELEASKTKAVEQTEKLRKDLEAREDKLRQIQTNLLLAEKELDKKFQATSAYLNMKKILVQKNNKIKGLRKKLQSLGVMEDVGEEDKEPGEITGDKVDDEGQVEEEGFSI